MKYSIKEIIKAWDKFTQPRWLVDNKKLDIKDLPPHGIIKYNEGVRQIPIDYSRWITYLVSEEWKK